MLRVPGQVVDSFLPRKQARHLGVANQEACVYVCLAVQLASAETARRLTWSLPKVRQRIKPGENKSRAAKANC